MQINPYELKEDDGRIRHTFELVLSRQEYCMLTTGSAMVFTSRTGKKFLIRVE